MVISFTKNQKNQRTETHVDTIISAAAAYVLINKKLPCPASPDSQGKSATQCSISHDFIGLVPYKTLGLPETTAKDGYGHWLTYAVDVSLTAASLQALQTEDVTLPSEFLFCEIASYAPLNVVNKARTSVIETSTDSVALVVVSHGPKGEGAYNANLSGRLSTTVPDKQSNTTGTPFVDRLPDKDYDDRVRWISRYNLMAQVAKYPCRKRF